jgi:flagellar assembly factor FliW
MFTPDVAPTSAPVPFDLLPSHADGLEAALHERWARVYEESKKAAKAPHEELTNAEPRLTFPEGLYGFGGYHSFVVVELDGAIGLQALVAVDDFTVQLPVVDAALAVPGYPLAEAQAASGITGEEVAVALVACRPADGGAMTVNMRAPIVIGLTSHRGVQVILGSELPLSHGI